MVSPSCDDNKNKMVQNIYMYDRSMTITFVKMAQHINKVICQTQSTIFRADGSTFKDNTYNINLL